MKPATQQVSVQPIVEAGVRGRLGSAWFWLRSRPWRQFISAYWVDAILVVSVLTIGAFTLYATPEFAANLPQDSDGYSLPAIHFLETGRPVMFAQGQSVPSQFPIGMSLLLMPAYWICGHFPGNGIHMIYFCALGAVFLVYWIGREVGGRLCGWFAGLFLLGNSGFQLYSKKMMSEVPSAFMLAVVLMCLFLLRKRENRFFVWFLLGVSAGWASIIRLDNMFALLPLVAICLTKRLRLNLRSLAFLLLGLLPFAALQGTFNTYYFGAPWRLGYRAIAGLGNDPNLPGFSLRYATAKGYVKAWGYSDTLTNYFDGNPLLYAKTIANQADCSLTFSHPLAWGKQPKRAYEILVILRGILALAGLGLCIYWRKTRPFPALFLWWTVGVTLCLYCILILYNWQEERYFLRFAPLWSILDGLGPASLLVYLHSHQRVPRLEIEVLVSALTGALALALIYISVAQLVSKSDDDLLLYACLHGASGVIESDAVVLTDYNPWRTDAYLIRGTQRLAIPVFPGGVVHGYPKDLPGSRAPNMPIDLKDEPQKFASLLGRSRPVYFLTEAPSRGLATLRLDTAINGLQMVPLANVQNGAVTSPYLYKLQSAGPQLFINH